MTGHGLGRQVDLEAREIDSPPEHGKCCSVCGEWKGCGEFHVRQSRCKPCAAAYDWAYNRSEAGKEVARRQIEKPERIISKRLVARMRREYGRMSDAQARCLLGVTTWQQVAEHLLPQLKPGQTMRDVQIDHVIEFKSGEPREVVCHYKNLQLLTKAEHHAKTHGIPKRPGLYKRTPRNIIQRRLIARMCWEYGKMPAREAQRLLGETFAEVAEFLCAQLQPGQTLDEMHIDHVVPFSSGQPREVVCDYRNLQLLTKEAHRVKTERDRRQYGGH